MGSWKWHTLLRQPWRRGITRALRMPFFREWDRAEVAHLEKEGENRKYSLAGAKEGAGEEKKKIRETREKPERKQKKRR